VSRASHQFMASGKLGVRRRRRPVDQLLKAPKAPKASKAAANAGANAGAKASEGVSEIAASVWLTGADLVAIAEVYGVPGVIVEGADAPSWYPAARETR
jgi:hypothetical protein